MAVAAGWGTPPAVAVVLRVTLAVVAVALLIPHAFSFMDPPSDEWSLPRVTSGDEPHYLVLINSIVNDHDLDVANNYREVHEGGDSGGVNFRNGRLDHHTGWIVNGQYRFWSQTYEMNVWSWPPNEAGHKIPNLAKGIDPSLAATYEVSYQWPGLAFLLTPVLLPFAGTRLLEPVALLCVWLAAVLAMLAFVSIARSLGAAPGAISVAVVLVFLGTPLWHYARALFTEAFAAAILLWAYALYLQGKRVWLAGLLCGGALLVKATLVMLVAPIGLALVWERRWKDTLVFGAPLVAAVLITMGINHAMFGRWLQGPQPWIPGDFVAGVKGLLVSTDHGLLPYAPVLVCAALGWPALLRAHRRAGLIALGGPLGLFCLTAAYALWTGGYCYGPRLVVPAIPFLMLGVLTRSSGPAKLWRRVDLAVLGFASVVINYRGAIHYWEYWSRHPLAPWFG